MNRLDVGFGVFGVENVEAIGSKLVDCGSDGGWLDAVVYDNHTVVEHYYRFGVDCSCYV
jgi:hypothetical protein